MNLKSIPLQSAIAALFIVSANVSAAATLPAFEDSFGFRAKLTAAANKANVLPVDGTHKAYIYFNLGDLPDGASIRYARLRIYLPKVTRAGNGLTIHKVTGSWDESLASVEPASDPTAIATIQAADLTAKGFVSVDLTDVVRDWLTTPASNEGVAIAAVPNASNLLVASIQVGAKEGSGSGYPAELDVELNPALGSIGSEQLATNLTLSGTTSGTFSGNGAALTGLAAANLTGTISNSQIGTGAVGTSTISDGSVTLEKLSPSLVELLTILAARPFPVPIDFVPVGFPGNSTEAVSGLGAVNSIFEIGKYEVTNAQYVEFLNCVSKADPLELFIDEMNENLEGGAGISRSGSSGEYVYTANAGAADLPVSWVSYCDAARFCNWLHNGKPVGPQGPATTEDGAYTITGGTTVGTRKAGASYFLPNENEWVKAGYYDGFKSGGPGYWLHSTRSNALPNSKTPNPTDANSANYYYDDTLSNGFNGGYATTNSTTRENTQRYLTPVGAYSLTTNFFGTFDQTGNAEETVEADGVDIFAKGVSAFGDQNGLLADFQNPHNSTDKGVGGGFRVAKVAEVSSTFFFDEFSDNTIDTALWQQATPFGDSSMTESSGEAVFTNKGRLVSKDSQSTSIEITGRFQFTGSTHDLFNIVTRANGTFSGNSVAEADMGIGIEMWMQNDSGNTTNNIKITRKVPGASTVISTTTFPINLATTYDFRITDDGTTISVFITDLSTPILTGTNSEIFGDKLAIYNREGSGGGSSISNGSVVKLDYIQVIPK